MLASQAGRRGFDPRLPLLMQPVDSRCQRVVLFDRVSTYGNGFDRGRLSRLRLPSLSRIDCNVLVLPVVGASVGASGEAVESSVPVALRTFAAVCLPSRQRERRQRFHRPGHVQQLRIGVGVHGQIHVGMTHRGLCRSRCHPALAQQCAERMAKGMNVNRSAAFVPLVDLPLCRRPPSPDEQCRRQPSPGQGFDQVPSAR